MTPGKGYPDGVAAVERHYGDWRDEAGVVSYIISGNAVAIRLDVVSEVPIQTANTGANLFGSVRFIPNKVCVYDGSSRHPGP